MFHLEKKLESGVRVGKLETPHGVIKTPFFMPVGTVGSVKATSPEELNDLGAEIILCNTYHLYLRPGEKLIKKLGGLRKFIGWNKPVLTDSGGYQVFSLSEKTAGGQSSVVGSISHKPQTTNHRLKSSLVKISAEGVEFTSHLDGSKHLFTPEKVIDIQLDLGVDILMPLDVCPGGKASREEVEKATELTIKWAQRSKLHFERQLEVRGQWSVRNHKPQTTSHRPLLHGIVQGGLYEDLRRHCTAELIKLDFDGYSVGGLAVDHETRDMWKTVKLMGEILPADKQRYLMGVGTPDDIIKATKLGMDMFDCVLPTRMARHGSVYVNCHSGLPSRLGLAETDDPESKNSFQLLNLLNNRFRTDGGVIDKNCGCPACRSPLKINKNSEIPPKLGRAKVDQKGSGFSRAYISHLIRSNEILGIRLATLHNLWQYLDLMRTLRNPQSCD